MYRLLLIQVLLAAFYTSDSFLFPDLKQRSVGSQSYKIAVLEEEPYLFSNGSGYVPELLRQVSKAYSALHGGKEIQLDVVPVRTWKQLMSKARSTRFQVAFGLQIPSLELTNWPGRYLKSTIPAVHTSAKVVSKGVIGGEMDDRRTGSGQVIVLKDSPLEYLLVSADTYPGPVFSAETPDAAMDYLRSATDDTIILTDAWCANYMAKKDTRDLRSMCPKEIPGTHSMHYAFFGKDTTLIDHLNEALLAMMSTDSLSPLRDFYFDANGMCSK